MITVGSRTARCPVCGGSGQRVIAHLEDGIAVESAAECNACRGAGHIAQAEHTVSEPSA